MSVYDFNHNEQITNNYSNNNVCNNNGSNSNGSRARPTELVTSKTAMYVRQRRAMLEQLSCYICQGYLIDAITIDECMDSFCKSCIIKYLRNHNNCPKCGTLIHETNPFGAMRSDKVLQDIVYKLVPGLYDDEMKRRRDFYRGIVGSSSSEEDTEESSGSNSGRSSMHSNEKYGIIPRPKQFYKPTDIIEVSIEPYTKGESSTVYYDNRKNSVVTCFTGATQPQQQQQHLNSLFSTVDSQKFKTYLRCPAKLTALQLKRFIAAKFNICRDDTIHLLYLNESLKDAYSLIDLAYIYDWRGTEHMRLLYKIERNLSSNRQMQVSPSAHKTVPPRQSVATSTQTVKRVCIDLNPKYYEVQSNSAPRTYGRNTASIPQVVQNKNSTTSVNQSTTTYTAPIPSATKNEYRNPLPAPTTNTQHQQPKQLTFSFVTERGITIVRRNNQDGAPSSTGSSCQYPALPAPESCTSTTHSMQANRQPTTSSSGVSNKQLNNPGGSSPRNHSKAAKPVYRVLVDPSKIKSPNCKKLGTARH